MRPTLWIRCAGLLCVALGAQLVYAQSSSTLRYRWVDASGLAHYSDKLDDAAVKHGFDVLNSNGMVVRHVQGELSREEQQARAATAAQEAAARKAEQQQGVRDRNLLQAYPTEADFQTAQDAHIHTLDLAIDTTRNNISSQELALTDLLDRAAEVSRSGARVPDTLQQKIDAQRHTVVAQRRQLQQQLAQRDQARRQAARELTHYRALRQRQQQAGAH